MNLYANKGSCTVANTVPIKFAYYGRSVVQGHVSPRILRSYIVSIVLLVLHSLIYNRRSVIPAANSGVQ